MGSLVLLAASACGTVQPEGGTERGKAALPPYCATTGGKDADFWRLVERSCSGGATDGDRRQAHALKRALAGLDAGDVADFHRTLVRVSRTLYTRDVAQQADALCLPGLGLGDDLFTDFRSWVIAHGQAAYDGVLAAPSLLAAFPDIERGCGLGEPFGEAALDVYLHKTGRSAARSGLPVLEPSRPPRA
nr:DUF4240 domain-containing protein [Nocardioides ginsengisegetis]